jgi:hypothetical protein
MSVNLRTPLGAAAWEGSKMATPFRRPTGVAVTALVGTVAAGIGLIYAPAQVTDAQSEQAAWGDVVVAIGILLVIGAVGWFGITHVNWPVWLTHARLKVYRKGTPDPNQWLLDAEQDHRRTFIQHLIITRKEVELDPTKQNVDEPFILFRYTIQNASLYRLTFEGVISESRILIYNQQMNDPPIMRGPAGEFLANSETQVTMYIRVTEAVLVQLKREMQTTTQIDGGHINMLAVQLSVAARPLSDGECYRARFGLLDSLPFVRMK